MKEKIYNLFYYCQDDIILEFGIIEHVFTGTDEQKNAFLKDQVISDFNKAKRYPIPSEYCDLYNNRMSNSRYIAFARQGRTIEKSIDY